MHGLGQTNGVCQFEGTAGVSDLAVGAHRIALKGERRSGNVRVATALLEPGCLNRFEKLLGKFKCFVHNIMTIRKKGQRANRKKIPKN